MAPPQENSSVIDLGSDSDSDSDIEVTGVAYLGKELFVIVDEDKIMTKPFVRKGPFRFLDLPAELRVAIYSYLLPHNVVISYAQGIPINPEFIHTEYGGILAYRNYSSSWRIDAKSKVDGTILPVRLGIQRYHKPKAPTWRWMWQRFPEPVSFARDDWLRPQTQVFLINKEIYNEVQAVLYGSNRYQFTINGGAHYPKSMASPLIFGALGGDDGFRLSLLRNLRSIHLDIILDVESHWAVKRQRARLEYFVSVLKEHSDDANRKSLLEELTIEIKVPIPDEPVHDRIPSQAPPPRYTPKVDLEGTERFMFGLESLASLRGIKDVKITGIPEWFARCLQLCIQGNGGIVLETDWPLVEVTRTTTSKNGYRKKRKTTWTSMRKWYHLMLDWKEFAGRNGINTPNDIDRFWMEDR